MADSVSRSWFCVFNNPADHGYEGTPQEVCEKLRDEWINNEPSRSGAWAYCISAEGLHHIHMVLEDEHPMRFSIIKKSYCKGMHFSPTKGTKKQADDYINKRGQFEEKGESIEFICYHGEIKGHQGARSDIINMYERLKRGETPRDILRDSPTAYLRTDVLKRMFYDIKSENTPIVRDVDVTWHTGASGSGKSYDRVKLAEKIGEENIFYLTSFNSGAFDNYNGQSVLWIEDYRGEFKLQEFLRLLDVYKAEIPARFTNVKALWTEVHITSVLTPREAYPSACTSDFDRIEQLLRRINHIAYHYKCIDGSYSKAYFPSDSLRVHMENQVNILKQFIPIYDPEEELSYE